MKCHLLNKDMKVATIEYDTFTHSITDVYEIHHIDHAPLSVENAYHTHSISIVKELNHWFKGRGIPSWRKELEKLLTNLGVETTDELLTKSYALSLSDQYWMKDQNSKVCWSDINFFEHDFTYKAYLDASFHESSTPHPDLRSPTNTTDGMLQKAWIIENGKRTLVKGTYTASRQEPINEWLASELCNRLGFDHCPYRIDVLDDRLISKCDNFISSNEEILSAYDILHSKKKKNHISDYTHYLSILQDHSIHCAETQLDNMLILDFLMMNTDRHMKNYGVIRDVDTLIWKRLTPIFDTGQSMNCDELTKNLNFHDGKGKLFTNTNKPFSTYLSFVSDLNRIDTSLLNGLDHEYDQILKQVQEYTEMSDLRIEKLVQGLQLRIKLLESEIKNNA